MRKSLEALIGAACAIVPVFGLEHRLPDTFGVKDELVLYVDAEGNLGADADAPYDEDVVNFGDDDTGLDEDSYTIDPALPGDEASPEVLLQDVVVRDDAVSGRIVNTSSRAIEDLQVQVRQTWRWKDGRHAGTGSPSRTLTYDVARPVPPNTSAMFRYEMPPLPKRSDGDFVTRVELGHGSASGW